MNSILFVDAGKEHRDFLADFFRKREFEAHCCANYEEAWELAAKKTFDVAVIDYFIGTESGSFLCDSIASRTGGRTALVITSDTQSTAIEIAIRRHNPAFFFVKPFVVDNLYAVALKIIETRDRKKLRTGKNAHAVHA